ncbi:hypothetical protein JCM8097_005865 [Rhodosporidiobolus ruineniae]
MRRVGLLALGVSSAWAASDPLLSPTIPSLSFFWQTNNDANMVIPSCAGFQVSTTANPNRVVEPQLPLYFSAFAEGYQPLVHELSTGINESFTWSAAFDVGAKVTFAMTDSANNSGGSVAGYTIIPGYANCTLQNNTATTRSPISFSAYPDDNACDEIDLKVNGGTAPYTVSVLAATSGTYANVTGAEESTIRMKNVVPAGQTFNLFVTDSKGKTSGVSHGMTSSLNLAGCNAATPPSDDSSTPVGAIVGGVIGGVVAAILIALLAWWLVRRRNQRAAEEYRRAGGGAATSEFRTADGRAPLVEPFNVPLAVSAAGIASGAAGGAAAGGSGSSSEPSPTSGNGSYDKNSMYASSSPVEQQQHYLHPPHPSNGLSAPPPPPLAHYQRHPSDAPSAYSAAATSPTALYDPYNPPAGYASYDSTASSSGMGTVVPANGSYDPSVGVPSSSPATEPHPSSLAHPSAQHQHGQIPSHHVVPVGSVGVAGGDGLANPEEFNYRLFDPSQGGGTGTWPPHGQGGGLPPGAGRYA